jgi:hypothetical protein
MLDKTMLDQTTLDQMTLDQTMLDQTMLDQTMLDQTTLDTTTLDQTTLDKTTLDQTMLDQTTLDQTILDKTMLDKPALYLISSCPIICPRCPERSFFLNQIRAKKVEQQIKVFVSNFSLEDLWRATFLLQSNYSSHSIFMRQEKRKLFLMRSEDFIN